MAEWTGWPSTTGHEHWPGAWSYGVDFTPDGCRRVLAVRLGGGEIKYGTDWTGPIDITVPGAAEALEAWAAVRLDGPGGYVHLFPADGDASSELIGWMREYEEEYGDVLPEGD